MNPTTADLIKTLRDTHGLSQTEIAKRTGIPQPRLSRWEGGAIPNGADDSLKLLQLVDSLKRKPAKRHPTKASA